MTKANDKLIARAKAHLDKVMKIVEQIDEHSVTKHDLEWAVKDAVDRINHIQYLQTLKKK